MASVAVSAALLRMATTMELVDLEPDAAAPAAAVPGNRPGSSWTAMSPAHRRILGPLQGMWETMSSAQRRRWELVAQRIGDKPPQALRRLHERMQAWARLTPVERTRIRLNYLRAKGAGRTAVRPALAATGGPSPAAGRTENRRLLPPAMVQAGPGASTVLLTTIFRVPAQGQAAPAAAGPPADLPEVIDAPKPDGVKPPTCAASPCHG